TRRGARRRLREMRLHDNWWGGVSGAHMTAKHAIGPPPKCECDSRGPHRTARENPGASSTTPAAAARARPSARPRPSMPRLWQALSRAVPLQLAQRPTAAANTP
ncbi:uncharacterized protein Tco025E_04384, partial [Trypanosoma conorhini]